MELWLFLLLEILIVGLALWLTYRWQQRWLARRRGKADREAGRARAANTETDPPETPEDKTNPMPPRPSYGAARYRTRQK